MLRATFCGLPHSESEVYYGKVSAIGRKPSGFAGPDGSRRSAIMFDYLCIGAYLPASLRSSEVWFLSVNTTSEALDPQLSASLVCGTAEASLLISIELLNIPSPTTLPPFRDARFNTLLFRHRRRRHAILRSLSATRSWAASGICCVVRGSSGTKPLPDRLG